LRGKKVSRRDVKLARVAEKPAEIPRGIKPIAAVLSGAVPAEYVLKANASGDVKYHCAYGT